MNVPPVRLLLAGMMGAGKSAVGAEIGRRTGWPHLDNDVLLESAYGRNAAALLETEGERALRDAEAAVLHGLLAREPPFVAGVAAGVVMRPEDRDLLAGDAAYVVYLRARLETLVRNVGSGAGRPWLAPEPAAALRELMAGRDPLYAAVADLTVGIDELSASAVADRILATLDEHRSHARR